MTFIDFARLHGIVIDSLPREGVWKRYKTEDKPQHRNGAVKWMGDHGFVQNHATMTEVASWRPDASAQAPTVDHAAVARRRDFERAQRVTAMRGARAFWAQSRPLNCLHPYLESKGLSALGCKDLRTHGELLVIPVWLGDWIISVQTITPGGEKRFWTGAPVKGGAFVLHRPRAPLTAVVEGLATGLAVYQSVKQASVIVAFDAGNLGPAVDQLKPAGSVVIAADNDHKTAGRIGANPGLEKAQALAERIGCGVAYPQSIEGSDWADFLAEVGDGAAKRMERLVLAKAKYVAQTVP